jgi:hypothetical protein
MVKQCAAVKRKVTEMQVNKTEHIIRRTNESYLVQTHIITQSPNKLFPQQQVTVLLHIIPV